MYVEYCIKLQLSKAKKIKAKRGFYSKQNKRDLYNTCIVSQLSRNKYCLNQNRERGIIDNRRKGNK